MRSYNKYSERGKTSVYVKMIAAAKQTDRAFNVTRYQEIKEWGDMKKLLLNAFETPYGAENLQRELSIIEMKNNETISS